MPGQAPGQYPRSRCGCSDGPGGDQAVTENKVAFITGVARGQGGLGISGYGKEGGRVGIDEFLRYKTVASSVPGPARWALLEEGADPFPEVVAGLDPLNRLRGCRPARRVLGVVLRGERVQAGGDRDG